MDRTKILWMLFIIAIAVWGYATYRIYTTAQQAVPHDFGGKAMSCMPAMNKSEVKGRTWI